MSHKANIARQGPCPLIRTPYKGCYCVDMTLNSPKVLSAIDYCIYGFEKCGIYIRHLQEDHLWHLQDGNNKEATSREDDHV